MRFLTIYRELFKQKINKKYISILAQYQLYFKKKIKITVKISFSLGIEKFLFITFWVKNITSMHYISFISVQIIEEISQKAKYYDNKTVLP